MQDNTTQEQLAQKIATLYYNFSVEPEVAARLYGASPKAQVQKLIEQEYKLLIEKVEGMKKFNEKKPLCGWNHWDDEVDICSGCTEVHRILDQVIIVLKEQIGE